MRDIEQDFVSLARLALAGQTRDALLLIRRSLSDLAKRRPELASELGQLLAGTGGPTRANTPPEPIPVDLDSRLELLRRDDQPVMPVIPTWLDSIGKELTQILLERSQLERLNAAGVLPTRSLLFVGPPVVGKSLAARYLASEMRRPLLTLDLAAVMSSFLGRTGNNIRTVLEFARRKPSILLLDEFDAIAKRRDDSAEIGELKRLVTVLLQAIDDWPSHGILIAATNHPDLLDPAVWRRFERILRFELPGFREIKNAVTIALQDDQQSVSPDTVTLLAALLTGQSFADIDRIIATARREAVIGRLPLSQVIEKRNAALMEKLNHPQKIGLAVLMNKEGFTQHDASKITGVSRDTIRSHSRADADDESNAQMTEV
jgi:SpoVK/Ycf46/Vps4 family AAA+-type ATPase